MAREGGRLDIWGPGGVGLQDGFGREGGLEVMLRIGGDAVLSKASL